MTRHSKSRESRGCTETICIARTRTCSLRTGSKSSRRRNRTRPHSCFLAAADMLLQTEPSVLQRSHQQDLCLGIQRCTTLRVEAQRHTQRSGVPYVFLSYVSITHRHASQVPTYRSKSKKHADPSGITSWAQAPFSQRLDEHVDHAQSADVAHSRGAAPTFGIGHASPVGGAVASPGFDLTSTSPAHPNSRATITYRFMFASLLDLIYEHVRACGAISGTDRKYRIGLGRSSNTARRMSGANRISSTWIGLALSNTRTRSGDLTRRHTHRSTLNVTILTSQRMAADSAAPRLLPANRPPRRNRLRNLLSPAAALRTSCRRAERQRLNASSFGSPGVARCHIGERRQSVQGFPTKPRSMWTTSDALPKP